MLRAMVFIDFENFNIALTEYYKKLGTKTPKLDYNLLPQRITEKLPKEHELLKTFLFAPKPDDFLMQDVRRDKTYGWINGLKNQKYFTVIEGQHIARPVGGYTKDTWNINNHDSYFVEEKGTDSNVAAHLLTKGFLNAYDTAILLSEDSDYAPVLDILNTFGKSTVVAGVMGQNVTYLKKHCDDIIVLDDNLFKTCMRSENKELAGVGV